MEEIILPSVPVEFTPPKAMEFTFHYLRFLKIKKKKKKAFKTITLNLISLKFKTNNNGY